MKRSHRFNIKWAWKKKLLIICFLPFLHQGYAQSSKKKAKDYYQIVYQSGNTQAGYGYVVYEKVKKGGCYEYMIIEGNMLNGKRTGFGKTLYFYSPNNCERIDFANRQSDSSRATDEINLLPNYYLELGNDRNVLKLVNYYYYIGLFKEDQIVKGTFFNSMTGVKFNGIFLYDGSFQYGTYDKKYRDTLIRGFLCMKELDFNSITCSNSGLRYYIADTSFRMVAYHQNEPIKNLYTFPMSEYNSQRKPVYNLTYKDGLYNGEVFDGKPEGLGEWISNDGEYVEYGYFKNGEPHGLFCKNFHIVSEDTKEKKYIDYYTQRPLKGIAVGVFTNGKHGKLYIDYGGTSYAGEVNELLQPHGLGQLSSSSRGLSETGQFVSGKLDGYGERIDMDKNIEKGIFKNGVLSQGFLQRSVYGLQKFDVVKVNGKRLMVAEKKGYGEDNAYVILSDSSILRKGAFFEMSPGDNSEFIRYCSVCNGSGYYTQTSTYQVLTGSETVVNKKFERIGSNDYVYTTTEIKPVYTKKSAYTTHSCGACEGVGKFVRFKK